MWRDVIKHKPYKTCCTFYKIPVLQTFNKCKSYMDQHLHAILDHVKLVNELLWYNDLGLSSLMPQITKSKSGRKASQVYQ